jgi:hypothetical protein
MMYSRSGCLVDEEGDFGLLKAEVHEAVLFVNGVAAEALAKEHVPVGLPVGVHMFLHGFGNLRAKGGRVSGQLPIGRALTILPSSSKSCSSRAFFATVMASSSMSSGMSAGQLTLA